MNYMEENKGEAIIHGEESKQREAGKFKRFFKWVNKKVCARDTQDEEENVDYSQRVKPSRSAPRQA